MADAFRNWLRSREERRKPRSAFKKWERKVADRPTRQMEEEAYQRAAAKHKREHPVCQFTSAGGTRCRKPTQETHHRRGRGKWLLIVKWFMSCCRYHHRWIHEHPKEAEALGYIVRDWNVPLDATLPK